MTISLYVRCKNCGQIMSYKEAEEGKCESKGKESDSSETDQAN